MTYACMLQIQCKDGEIQVMVGSKDEHVISDLTHSSKVIKSHLTLETKLTELCSFVDSSNPNDNTGMSEYFEGLLNSDSDEKNPDESENFTSFDIDSECSDDYNNMCDTEDVDETLLKKFVIDNFPQSEVEIKKDMSDIDLVIEKQRTGEFTRFRKEVSKDRAYKCLVCNDRFSSSLALGRHVKLRHVNNMDQYPYGCIYCDNGVSQAEHVLKHLATHKPPYRCVDHCNQRFCSTGLLKRHLLRVKKMFNFKCDLCSASFLLERELQMHLKTHKTSRKPGFDKQSPGSKLRPHGCDQCNKTYRTEKALKNHVDVQHAEARARNHVCKECGKRYLTSGGLYTHMWRSHDS